MIEETYTRAGSVVCCGEVMIEMASLASSDNSYRQGIAGDTFNTAVYLARAGLPTSYLTRLGDDPWSDRMMKALTREGIDTSLVQRSNNRLPGLYTIHNTSDGEREFSYWRENSPARQLFDEVPAVGSPGLFYFSGITLAVCHSGLDQLIALLHELRNKPCRVIFDPNYRAGLWGSEQRAREAYRRILPLCDTAMPTLEDESLLWDIDNVEQCAAFYQDFGIEEVIVKAPCLTAHVFRAGQHWSQQATQVAAVDTTGAGDSFNAAYIAACFHGKEVSDAIAAAQQLAGRVVQQPGAIL